MIFLYFSIVSFWLSADLNDTSYETNPTPTLIFPQNMLSQLPLSVDAIGFPETYFNASTCKKDNWTE